MIRVNVTATRAAKNTAEIMMWRPAAGPGGISSCPVVLKTRTRTVTVTPGA